MSNRKDPLSMHKLRVALLAALCAGAVAGCNTNTSPGNIVAGKVAMQLAVGTLNDTFGTATGAPGTYLNAVATFRGQFGGSAFLNPGIATLSGPGGLAATVCGIFSYGQSPGVNGLVGLPPAYTPANSNGIGYATGVIFPIVTTTPACATPLAPAFPLPPPTSGTYGLKTVVQANGQNQPYGASATLPATPTVLGNESAPSYASGGATGGGTFTVSVPAGVTETLVVVLQSGAEVATAKTTGTTATLPAGTLTPGTSYTAFAIGADYPLVEAGPPASTSMAPKLTGAGGTSDLTVSGAAGFTQ